MHPPLLIDCIALFCGASQLIRGLMCCMYVCRERQAVGGQTGARNLCRTAAGQHTDTLGQKRDDCMLVLYRCDGRGALYATHCSANHILCALVCFSL